MTITVEVTRPILQDAGGCWKHKVLKKKAMFPVKKSFSPILSRIIEHDKRQGKIFKGPQGNILFTVEIIIPFLQDLRRCWKHKNFKKEGNLSNDEKVLDFLSRIADNGKRHGTTYKSPQCHQGNLKVSVDFWRSLVYDPSDCWRHNLLKKKEAIFPVKKKIWSNFSHITPYDRHRITFC